MPALFGTAAVRKEDPRLLGGHGLFTDDIRLPGLAYAAFARSTHAAARVRVDAAAAQAMAGVLGVFTAADVEGRVGTVPTAWLVPDCDLKTPARPVLAGAEVRYVGEPLAMVVARSRAEAADAAAAVTVAYDPLPCVVDGKDALASGAPQLHPDVPGNVLFRWRCGDRALADRAFAEAPVAVSLSIRQQRLVPAAIEPRAAVAQPGPEGDLTLWSTTQNPHIARFVAAAVLGIAEQRLRVVAPDVGGGFGSKIPVYPDELMVAHAARVLGVPVKWTETRSEAFLGTIHGRDQSQEVSLCGLGDGTITGLRVRAVANMGAYLSLAAPGVPTILFGLITPGAYRIAAVDVEVTGVATHTTPVDAYRGAGRPEATFLVERLVDAFARKIGLDPAEVRRRNFIPRDAFPYATATGLTYDSGDYHTSLRNALEAVGYEGLRRRQEDLRLQGRYLGIGLSSYVEVCGLGPSKVAGAVGFQGGLWESATVRVHPSGKVTVLIGASPHGQGEETTFAQVVADELGVPLSDIEVVHGDTDRSPMGWGTYGSRTTPVGGPATALAARKVVAKLRRLAAHLLEAAEADIVVEEGLYHVQGAPGRSLTFAALALQAHLAWRLPEGMEPGLEESAFYDPENFVFPFGTHVCVVEVDAHTGEVRILRYVAADDCGRMINPMIVDGQVHGGVAQGIGQALYEGAAYDSAGQLLTASFLDYALPKARLMPPLETLHTETPSPHTPLGVKGVGETGTIAATPAVVNAVMDALAPLGIDNLDMPLTPDKVWRSIRDARPGGAAGEEGSR
jgi:aerobic carbon-monoxide dehydrogenase large subunit